MKVNSLWNFENLQKGVTINCTRGVFYLKLIMVVNTTYQSKILFWVHLHRHWPLLGRSLYSFASLVDSRAYSCGLQSPSTLNFVLKWCVLFPLHVVTRKSCSRHLWDLNPSTGSLVHSSSSRSSTKSRKNLSISSLRSKTSVLQVTGEGQGTFGHFDCLEQNSGILYLERYPRWQLDKKIWGNI